MCSSSNANRTVQILYKAFSYLSQEQLTICFPFDTLPGSGWHYQAVQFKSPYPITGTFFSKLKFYKNGRLDVFFKSEADLNKFITLFELNELK